MSLQMVAVDQAANIGIQFQGERGAEDRYIEVESVTAKHGSNPPPGRDRAEGEGEMNKPTTRPAAPATTQAHCNTCGGTRKHDVLFFKTKTLG